MGKEELDKIIGGLSVDEADALLYEMDRESYSEKPVDIETFLESSEFIWGS